MAVAARVKSLAELSLGQTTGPTIVYLDVAIGETPPRRLHIELFVDELPETCDNFRMLCTGERKGNAKVRALWYKQTPFHRIVPGFMMQGGDITHGNGAGGASVYTRTFDDESFLYQVQLTAVEQSLLVLYLTPRYIKHQVGSVSMAHQSNSNKSQFFISFIPASWCDGKHVVFGQVLAEDLMHLSAIEAVGSPSGLPLARVVVTDCGQLSGDGYMPTAKSS